MKLEVNKIKQLNKGKLLSSYMSSPLTLEFRDFSFKWNKVAAGTNIER